MKDVQTQLWKRENLPLSNVKDIESFKQTIFSWWGTKRRFLEENVMFFSIPYYIYIGLKKAQFFGIKFFLEFLSISSKKKKKKKKEEEEEEEEEESYFFHSLWIPGLSSLPQDWDFN